MACVTREHGFLNFNASRGSPTAHDYVYANVKNLLIERR